MMNEKRLISANKLLEAIEETAEGLADCDQQNAAWALRKYAVREISEAPTVDAVEVVHGRWIDICLVDGSSPWEYRCSECGCPQDYAHNYCPNCGAKMDGGKTNAQ